MMMKYLLYLGMNNLVLSNEDLRLCNYIVSIPTDESYTSSLNLASAVQNFLMSFSSFVISESKTIFKIDPDFASQSTKNHLIEVFLSS